MRKEEGEHGWPEYSELFSPTDFRYSVNDLKSILSEEAFVNYKVKVEATLAQQLANVGICSHAIAREIAKACENVTAKEVYKEEARIKHDIRALANVIRSKVSKNAKPFVHLTATSYDVVDTANALRLRDAINEVILPDLVKLENVLIKISLKYFSATQIGRTHGQHAEPITFGFFVANYVSRLGQRIAKLSSASRNLRGKFSGAVGVYGPLSLILPNPERFESGLLSSLGLEPSEVSTQIVQPEPTTDLMHYVISTFGVIANLARDLRHLQRSEISEISEEFGGGQVGSSTMPQKRNPISFENVESMWKKFMPQMVTIYMDQISEHQRDLTNSLSQRYLPELLVAFDYAVRRLTNTLWDEKRNQTKLAIDVPMMLQNLKRSSDKIAAEPLYVLLSLAGHPDAHETVRRIVQKSISEKKSFLETAKSDEEMSKFLGRIPRSKWKMVENPWLYRGVASSKTRRVALKWRKNIRNIPHPLS